MSTLQWIPFIIGTAALCTGGLWSARTLFAPPADGTVHMMTPRAHGLVLVALVGYTLFLLARATMLNALPISNVFEALTFFLWCTMCIAIWTMSRTRMDTLPTFLLPFLAVLALLALALVRGTGHIRPELRTPWFLIHMLCAFMGYAAFTIGAFTASMYVLQERRLRHKRLAGLSRRLPPLEALENMNRQLLALGFPLFTVAIGLGVVLAHKHNLLKGPWQQDAKVISAGVTWVAYAVLFIGNRMAVLYGRKVAWGTVAGFFGVLFTFLGTTLLLGVTHGNY